LLFPTGFAGPDPPDRGAEKAPAGSDRQKKGAPDLVKKKKKKTTFNFLPPVAGLNISVKKIFQPRAKPSSS
jgi:hypothetical protein